MSSFFKFHHGALHSKIWLFLSSVKDILYSWNSTKRFFFFLLFFFLSFFYDSVVLRDTEEWPPLMVALQCMAPRRPCMVQALVPRCMAARHPSTMVRPIKRHHLNFSLCCVFGVFFPELCFVTGSRTPHYGSQTPLHDGSRTPGQSGAWDPNNPNTPSRQERKTRIHYKPV